MFELRPARAADKAAILEFCQQTFSWGDYIHHVYDEWLADPNGDMTVATVDGVPVALARIRYLSSTEAWFEGLRVNPAFRRHGMGHAIAQYNQARAISRGIVVGRAFISATNIASQNLSSGMGFVQIDQYHGHDLRHAVKRSTAPYIVRPASAEDMPEIITFMQDYRHALLSWHWQAQQVSAQALQRALAANSLWVALLDGRVACVSAGTFWDDDKEMQIVGLFSQQVAPAEAVVQHMINEHSVGNIAELRVYRHHEQPSIELASLGFEPNPDAVSGIWELKLARPNS
ncbi:MAG: GNAT family N-acetyltransferase [Peptococcaceae bacterium]|nr:GNAT family N-acetyltransferase [Peptococcaceae bacterium]